MLARNWRHAERVTSPSSAGFPEQIGPYRIVDVLGQGGMGVVHRGEHVETGEPVAVKTVRCTSEGHLSSIRREIHALSQIRHPGVVRIIAQGVADGLPWYAMELLRHPSLREALQDLWGDGAEELVFATTVRARSRASRSASSTQVIRGGPASGPAVTAARRASAPPARLDLLGVLRRLCSPLAYLHGKGIVHRDLKPENVFVREGGAPVLVDFGVAAQCFGARGREVLQAEGRIIGSASYIAPEQILGELVDARADLYALGCILYECVTGSPPFSSPRLDVVLYQHLNQAPVPPSCLVDGVPPGLDQLILRLLEKRPEDRLGHALDVAAALGALGVPGAPAGDEPPAQPYLYRPAFAGRSALLRELGDALDRAQGGQGGCVLVGGESGVGKTRLAMELGALAARRGFTVLTCACIPVSAAPGSAAMRAAPLHPLRPFLLAVADRCREQGEAEAARLLGARGRILEPCEPSLAAVPGHGQEGLPPPSSLPPPAARARLLAALRDTLFALADSQPVLLLVDDLQWADELSLSFLRALIDGGQGGVAGRRVLALGAYRVEEVHPALDELLRAPGAQLLTLGRLGSATVRAMVGGMLALEEPPADLVTFLEQQSRGNPFFIAEYLRAAIGEGLLDRDTCGRWRLRERAPAAGPRRRLEEALPLPRSLAELIETRLLGLSPASRALVELSAVLGRELEAALLSSTSALGEAEEMTALEELRTRQILEEAGEGRLRFVHDKLREIAYARIPGARRPALHRRAAAAIEARHAGTPELCRLASSLGHHWSVAGEHGRASQYLIQAGDRAKAAYANGEAIALYHAALDELRALLGPGGVPPEPRWLEVLGRLHESLGDVLELTGQHDGAREAHWTALSRAPAGDRIARARLHRKIGKAWEVQHQHEEALRAYEAAQGALGSAPEPGEGGEDGKGGEGGEGGEGGAGGEGGEGGAGGERGAGGTSESAARWWHEWIEIQVSRAWVHYWLAQVDEMQALVERVRPVVEARGTPIQRAHLWQSITLTSARRERYATSDETVACGCAYLAASQESEDPSEIAMARFVLGFELAFHGDLDEAEQELEAGLRDADRIGDITLASRCLNYLAVVERLRGRVEEARRAAERSLAAAEAAKMIDYAGASRGNLACAALRAGDLDEAARQGEAALALWGQLSVVYPYPFQGLALWPLIEVRLARGRTGDAVDHARALLEPRQQRLPDDLAAALGQAIAAWDEGRGGDAAAWLARAAEGARRRGHL